MMVITIITDMMYYNVVNYMEIHDGFHGFHMS